MDQMEWMEHMEKQISNLQTMVQGAKMLAKNSKEVTEINRRLPKEENNYGKNSSTRTSDKSHLGNLNSIPSLDFQPTEDINNLVKLLNPFHHIEVSPPPCAAVPIQAQPPQLFQNSPITTNNRVSTQSHLQINNPPPNKPISYRENSSTPLAIEAPS
jgi:hypothetical protein